MVQDALDDKHYNNNQMDIDQVSEEGDWEDSGQTLVGKNGKGEEVLYSLQRRGNSMRVAPKARARARARAKPRETRGTSRQPLEG